MTDTTLFQRIMEASAAYVERMGGSQEFQGAIRKMYEEMREYEVALIAYTQARTNETPMSLRLKTPDQLRLETLREYIDFMVTAGGVFAVLGIRFEDIEQAAHDTLAKLDARTTQTHQWNPETKTVERIGKIAPHADVNDFHTHAQLNAAQRPMKRES